LGRRGGGRRVTVYVVRFTEDYRDLEDRFRAIAEREGWSFNRLLLEAVREYVERHHRGGHHVPLSVWTEEEPAPESYRLLELIRRRYGPRRSVSWSAALEDYRRMLADGVKPDLLERVLRRLEADGWSVTWPG